MNPDTSRAILAELARPFALADIKWKPQTVNGNRALPVAFVDARAVQNRLDAVFGVAGWQDSYEVLASGDVICRLSVRLPGSTEWITRTDVGGQSKQPDAGDRLKSAFSVALKRAAVKFGIGRYLYRIKMDWCDYDPQKKRFVKQPTMPPIGTPAPRPDTKPVPQPSRNGTPPPPPGPDARPAPQTARDTSGNKPYPPAEATQPYDRDEDDANLVADDMLGYLLWLAKSRNKNPQKLAERFGVATLWDLTVGDYRQAVEGLRVLPRVQGD